MKRINFPLCIGIILLTILLLLSLFPKVFTDIDPTTATPYKVLKTLRDDGYENTSIEAHPAGPDSENILGTDELGRDIYARLVYGTKTTLKAALLVVLFRLLLAVPIGLAAGIGVKAASFIIRFFNAVFTAIPILFVSFFVLNIKYITDLQIEHSIIAFAIVLSVLGWGKLARQIEEKASKIMNEEFIEGEIAVGKSKIQIAVQNMLPHLVPSLVSFIFIEVGLVIFLFAQLSILGVFIGPRIPFLDMDGNLRWMLGQQPEWASMLSSMIIYNRIGKYWVGLYPALAFTIGILAFNLTGEGLRIEFEKRNSKVVSTIRRFGFIFSPKIYFLQLLRFKEYYKPVLIKSLCMLLVVTYIFIPAPKSLYAFQVDNAMETLEELMKPEYEGRVSGYEGNYLAGDYILEKLQEYGLEPYDGQNYIQTFPLFKESIYADNISNLIVEEAFINIKDKSGEVSTYRLYDDFEVVAFGKKDIDNDKSQLDEDGYLAFKGVSFTNLDEYTQQVKIGKSIDLMYAELFPNNHSAIRKISDLRFRHVLPSYVSFFIVEDYTQQVFPTFLSSNHIIIPKGELSEKLKTDNCDIEIKIKPPKMPNYEGRNIFAVLPGKDWDKPNDSQNKKEVIIIGASYDGIGMANNNTSAIRSSKAAINLEIARTLSETKEKLDKTIIFAFWDGESLFNAGSNYYNVYDRIFDQKNYIVYYLDIGFSGVDDSIRIDVESPPIFRVDTYDIVNDINKRFKKKKIKYTSGKSGNTTFHSIGQNLSLKISAHSDNYYYLDTDKDTVANMSKTQLENIGQFFIDLITMNKHFK